MRSLEEMEAIERIAEAVARSVSDQTCEQCLELGDVQVLPRDVEVILDRLGLQLVRTGPLHPGAHPLHD